MKLCTSVQALAEGYRQTSKNVLSLVSYSFDFRTFSVKTLPIFRTFSINIPPIFRTFSKNLPLRLGFFPFASPCLASTCGSYASIRRSYASACRSNASADQSGSDWLIKAMLSSLSNKILYIKVML